MHEFTEETAALARAIEAYAHARIAEPQPLDRTMSAAELTKLAGETITPGGIGGHEALRIWAEILAPATISTDHPANLAFVPAAPTKAAVLFDLVVGASSTIGAAWIDGAGGIWAENQALRWIADLAGLPDTAGGTFVSGGSAGNLAGLVAARTRSAAARPRPPDGWAVVTSVGAHASIEAAARLLDVELITVPGDALGRLRGDALRARLAELGPDVDRVVAVVATAGTTNAGLVDDLEGVGALCRERGLWFHVDAAYGGAALAAPSVRDRFRGIELADSLIVDPHKWLFAPYDCCALVYRDALAVARSGAFKQEASYLDSAAELERDEIGPWDLAYHLSRRIRGLPFWFSLATYGTDAYRDAVETVLELTRRAADEVRSRPELELVLEPELSVLLFRRRGWEPQDFESWWRRLLDEQVAFVQPTTWLGEKVARLCFVNPRTTLDHVRGILDTMR
ncbi:MAG: glutamate decarboxylase [Actinomycetota bacterium]|nr:MAG: glutamate decarboxylase [Actinomycetota bacterium]